MKKRGLLKDKGGATALEFAMCAPVFFALMMGIVELGLATWMQVTLQQGVEAAARCASIDTNNCASTSQIQAWAAAQSAGLSVPASVFTVTKASCGNQVQASYQPTYLPSFPVPVPTLTASACFPI
jgi:Flp pilus assembly protein TadG